MAALGSQSIASSYEQLLHVDADGGGNGTTHVSVKDGDNGTTFGFTIASDALMMSSTNRLEFGDTGTYIHQSADGVLDLVSDTELELNATTIDINGTVDISGDVGIGGSPTAITNHRVLEITNTGTNGRATLALTANAGEYSNLYMGDSDIDVGGIQYYHGTNQMDFYTNTASRMTIESGGDIDIQTGDIVFSTADKGICLGVTSNTDANTLDDYEEGTWTVTAVGSSSGNFVLSGSEETGVYTKIGRVVHIQGGIQISSDNSAAGNINFSLPFTNADRGDLGGRIYGTAYLINAGSTLAGKIILHIGESNAYFNLIQVSDDGATYDTIDVDDVDPNWFLGFAATFTV